ncbi:MAG: hypothetical protein IPJ65_17245 [Archangiaceae bacterium]|nr:hypothetical protein [Archangiaceae bacterium]
MNLFRSNRNRPQVLVQKPEDKRPLVDLERYRVTRTDLPVVRAPSPWARLWARWFRRPATA